MGRIQSIGRVRTAAVKGLNSLSIDLLGFSQMITRGRCWKFKKLCKLARKLRINEPSLFGRFRSP
jgi:hypothetical protein